MFVLLDYLASALVFHNLPLTSRVLEDPCVTLRDGPTLGNSHDGHTLPNFIPVFSFSFHACFSHTPLHPPGAVLQGLRDCFPNHSTRILSSVRPPGPSLQVFLSCTSCPACSPIILGCLSLYQIPLTEFSKSPGLLKKEK